MPQQQDWKRIFIRAGFNRRQMYVDVAPLQVAHLKDRDAPMPIWRSTTPAPACPDSLSSPTLHGYCDLEYLHLALPFHQDHQRHKSPCLTSTLIIMALRLLHALPLRDSEEWWFTRLLIQYPLPFASSLHSCTFCSHKSMPTTSTTSGQFLTLHPFVDTGAAVCPSGKNIKRQSKLLNL
jgi:hypothetical protein